MTSHHYSTLHLLIAAGVGAALSYGVFLAVSDDTAQREQIAALENKIQALEKPPLPRPGESANPAQDIERIRKDLSTRFIGDPRTFGEKLHDFVAENAHPQTIAIACKVIADLGENPDTLTNPELQSLYNSQTNIELKRVLAQVLSLRGDNSLLEKLVAEARTSLASTNPAERSRILIELAKTRYAGAANAIVPLVQDAELSVQLDALLALRATGNESHIAHLDKLLNHPDQSVSWLANDALNQLQNLSTKARTRVTLADINAELPPINAY